MKPCDNRVSDPRIGAIKQTCAHLGTRLRDRTEVVDEVGLRHTDTGVDDRQDLVLLVGNDLDDEVLAGLEDGGVGEGGITDLVERIRRVRDQFTEEDLLVGVEGVCATRVQYMEKDKPEYTH